MNRWVILSAAAVSFMAAQGFGRFGFALILPSMREGLSLSTGEMGLIAGAGFAAYVLLAAPAGALAARFGSRWVVVAGLLGTAAGLAGTGAADSFASAAAAQILAGATSPLAVVPNLAIAAAWFAPAARGRATGLVVGGGGVGILLAGLVIPILLGAGESGDWRRAWWGLAAGTLVAAGLAAAFLRDPPARHKPDTTLNLRLVYRSAAIWRLAFLFGLYGVSYIVYGTFFAAALAQRDVDAPAAGWLWALAGAVSIGSGLLGGALADRLGPGPALVAMYAGQAGSLAALALGDGIAWYLLSVLLYGLSVWGFPSAMSKACAEVVGPVLARAALGLLAMTFGIGQTLGPIMAGLMSDWTGAFTAGLLFAAATSAVGAIGSALLPRSHSTLPRRGPG